MQQGVAVVESTCNESMAASAVRDQVPMAHYLQSTKKNRKYSGKMEQRFFCVFTVCIRLLWSFVFCTIPFDMYYVYSVLPFWGNKNNNNCCYYYYYYHSEHNSSGADFGPGQSDGR